MKSDPLPAVPVIADSNGVFHSEERHRLGVLSCIKLWLFIAKLKLKERIEFDSTLIRAAFGFVGFLVGRTLQLLGHHRRGMIILSKFHRSAFADWIRLAVESRLRIAVGSEGPRLALVRALSDHVDQSCRMEHASIFMKDPGRLLHSLVMVLKSPRTEEKGTIIIKYSHAFALICKLYDMEAIAAKYHIVIEPSWTGYCNLDILTFTRYRFPVFVQAYEPRDHDFIRNINANLLPVRVSPNWWVDHKIYKPDIELRKDFDIIMIASWANFKRHHRFFAALRVLKLRGSEFKVVLLGYPIDSTLERIRELAVYYGVSENVEIHEQVPPEAVGDFLRRSKINIIWSRREGVNRAIVEGMFAGVPCILREGFNYGYRYPYINKSTGAFSSEADLPDNLKWMIENYRSFAPRDWVMANMTCQIATRILEEAIRSRAIQDGERWTIGLAVKVNSLCNMAYFEEADASRFQPDYDFLRSMILPAAHKT